MGAGAQLGKIENVARQAMACAGEDVDQAPRLSLPTDFARHFAQGFGWTCGAGAGVLILALLARAVLS